MQRSLSRFIHISFVIVNLALGLPVFAQETVTITLGVTNNEAGLFLKEPDGGATTVVTNGGSSARSTVPPLGKTGGFMYFATDPAFANAGSVTTVFVTVEYWDEGTDQFRIEYDAQPDPNNPNPDTDPFTPAQNGAAIAKYDTRKWVTYQFRLANVYFGKRQPGPSDFRINDLTVDAQGNPVDGEAPEVIRKVVVSKTEPIPLHIKFANVPPKIDGLLDDEAWKDAQVFKVDSAIQDVIRPSAWQGTNDYSLDGRFAWDSSYLYLAYDVNDDVPRVNNDVPATSYQGDGAEVYFGFDQSNPGRSTYLPDTDFHVIISAGPNPTWLVAFLNGTFEPVAGGPFQPADNLIVKDRPNGYILEARIPWAMLVGANGKTNPPPVPGQLVGFNVFGNDGDNPDAPAQEVAMGFTGRPRAYLDPGAWATVQLDPSTSSPPPATGRLTITGNPDFGQTDLGGSGVVRTFTIANVGTAPVNLSGTPKVAVTGPQASDFTVTAQPTTPIPPVGNTSFTIRFAPAAAGVRNATVSIQNDGDKNPFDLAITGTGAGATQGQGFQLIENFQQTTPGDLNGQRGWSASLALVKADPTQPTNQVASFEGDAAGGANLPLLIAEGTTATLFFRTYSEADTTLVDWFAGMSDVDVVGLGNYPDFEAQIGYSGSQILDTLRVRHGPAGDNVAAGEFLPRTWYKIWAVIDNTADTYQVYIQGGSYTNQTQVAAEADGNTTFTFRNSSAGPEANDLIRFFVKAGSDILPGPGLLDDIYLATGKVLTDPVGGAGAVTSLRISEIKPDSTTGNITLTWEGDGPQFQVEKATNTITGTFQPLGAVQSARVYTDTNALKTAAQSFYRIVQVSTNTPGPACVTTPAAPIETWVNTPFANQTGTFTATFDATPSAVPIDSVMALSSGAKTAFPDFACLVRFNGPTGVIDARNGADYAGPTPDILYAANVKYHFRLVVNVPAKTYSIYVTPAGGVEQTVGVDFAFRPTAVGTNLNSWGVESGTLGASNTLCDFKITP